MHTLTSRFNRCVLLQSFSSVRDTRVQGRQEMWQALRVAVEAGDDSTSAAILESAGLQPFDIDAVERFFTYDQKGFKYEVPLYCLYAPSNLLRDAPPPAAAAATAKAAQAPLQVQVAPSSARSQQHSSVNDEAKSAEPQSQVQAGAAPATVGGGTGKSLKFTIRFSNGLADYPLDARSSTSIAALKSLICSRHPSLAPLHDSLRLYYLGKWMSQPAWTLGEIGMKKEMVLQCFIPGVGRKAE